MAEPATQTPPKPATQQQKKSVAPFFFFGFSFFCFAFWIACILIDVQASEALFGAPSAKSLLPNWVILWQPIQFCMGDLSSSMVVPVLVGWIVEIFYLIFTFAHEVTHASVSKFNRMLAGPFKTFCWVVVAYNGYSNFQAGFVPGGMWPQLVFAAVMSAAVLFLGTAGIMLFRMGLSEW